MSETEVARDIFKTNKKQDFLFEYEGSLYRARVLKSGSVKTKEICTGIPRLLGTKQVTDRPNSSWRYIFEVRSEKHGTVKMTLAASEFLTIGAFKRSVLSRIPVVFMGSKGDFEFFLGKEMNRLVESMPRGTAALGCDVSRL